MKGMTKLSAKPAGPPVWEQGQANKSKGRMPRHQEPKKDAESCEKPRGGATATDPGVSEWGNPIEANLYHPIANP